MKIKFGKRKIQQIRYSFTIPLPPEWVRSMGIKKGDRIEIEMNDDNTLRIAPVDAYHDTTGCSQTA